MGPKELYWLIIENHYLRQMFPVTSVALTNFVLHGRQITNAMGKTEECKSDFSLLQDLAEYNISINRVIIISTLRTKNR